jgi:FkbM family methyltransferase
MLRRILYKIGLQPISKKTKAWGRMAERSRFMDIKERLSTVKTIVDAGAAHGEMTEFFLRMFPEAKIHAIEPNPNSVKSLEEKFSGNPRVTIHPIALGSINSTIQFNVLNRADSSSILKPTALNHHYHPQEMDVAQEIQVPLRRLDELISQPIDLLKLDLQGYELETLKGATQILKQIRAITTEIEFVPLYENQPLFSDIDIFLRQNGFSLLNLYELWTQEDGQLTAGDAVYLRQNENDRK